MYAHTDCAMSQLPKRIKYFEKQQMNTITLTMVIFGKEGGQPSPVLFLKRIWHDMRQGQKYKKLKYNTFLVQNCNVIAVVNVYILQNWSGIENTIRTQQTTNLFSADAEIC